MRMSVAEATNRATEMLAALVNDPAPPEARQCAGGDAMLRQIVLGALVWVLICVVMYLLGGWDGLVMFVMVTVIGELGWHAWAEQGLRAAVERHVRFPPRAE
jgi:hypothetical protein